MATLFDAVRGISAIEAAERAGLHIKKNYGGRAWVCCPLHGEKTPSLCLYQDPSRGWVCYGCHKGGDAVNLYAEIYTLSRVDAAKQLAEDFGITYENKPRSSKREPPKPTVYNLQRALERRRNEEYAELCDELHAAERVQDAAQAILSQYPPDDTTWADARFNTALKALAAAQTRKLNLETELDYLHTADYTALAARYGGGEHK